MIKCMCTHFMNNCVTVQLGFDFNVKSHWFRRSATQLDTFNTVQLTVFLLVLHFFKFNGKKL